MSPTELCFYRVFTCMSNETVPHVEQGPFILLEHLKSFQFCWGSCCYDFGGLDCLLVDFLFLAFALPIHFRFISLIISLVSSPLFSFLFYKSRKYIVYSYINLNIDLLSRVEIQHIICYNSLNISIFFKLNFIYILVLWMDFLSVRITFSQSGRWCINTNLVFWYFDIYIF